VTVRILFFSQYFSPEVGATQARMHTFASGLAAHGHEIDVVCGLPNHPQGVVRPGYRRRLVVRRRDDGFGVNHVWVWTSPVKTTARRLAYYASYAASAALTGSLLRRPDVIFATSPPLPGAASAGLVAARHRIPWVLDVRDLWPGAAVALGELSSRRLLRLAELLERRLYASAAAVTAVTDPFCRAIASKCDPAKVHLLPNGTTRLWLEGAGLEPNREELGLPTDRFIWTYAGNLGIAQGLHVALDAAARLGSRYQLLLLGDGPVRGELMRRAASLAPGTVAFRDQVPPEVAVRYLRASDALLVPLAPRPELRDFVPSKLYDFCAVGRPVVAAAAGEPERLALESGAALPIPPGDAAALEDAMCKLAQDGGLRDRLARAGERFGAAHLREEQVERLEALLGQVVHR
jgi:glycosyltransferase involved in cell wall biosynthesis